MVSGFVSLDRAGMPADRVGADRGPAGTDERGRRAPDGVLATDPVSAPLLPKAAASLRRHRGAAIASASLAPGSDLAKDNSMPIAAMVASTEDNPCEINGSGTPVMGRRPMTAQMLTSACTTIQAVAAAAASRMNGSVTRLATLSPAYASPA
jgi:hypothetical protein